MTYGEESSPFFHSGSFMSSDIDERIKRLDPDDEDEHDELEALYQFRIEVKNLCGESTWENDIEFRDIDRCDDDWAKEYYEDRETVDFEDEPYCHIDWYAVAESLRSDYNEVELWDYTYLIME